MKEAGCSRVTHPSAAKNQKQAPNSSLDLHVLGTPPAFVLSQDQTLVFDSVLNLEVSFKLKTHVRIDCLCFDATRENRISRLSSLFCIVFKDPLSLGSAVCLARGDLMYYT